MNESTLQVMFSSAERRWATPKPFYDKLNREFAFSVDVCAEDTTAKNARYFTEKDDCLIQDWHEVGHWLRDDGQLCSCPCHVYTPKIVYDYRQQRQHDPGGWARACKDCRDESECELSAASFFMNPPYGDPEYPCEPGCKKKKCAERGWHAETYIPGIIDFMRKAYLESCLGATGVCLVPNRSCADWYHRYVLGKADEVRQVRGRLKFETPDGPGMSAPFPSIAVVYRPIIRATRLEGMSRR